MVTAIRQRHAHIGRLPWAPARRDDQWTPNTPDWLDSAACTQVDPEIFYPDLGEPAAKAKSVCAGCPARPDCLEWALDEVEVWGIWGGTSPLERRAIRLAREQVAA